MKKKGRHLGEKLLASLLPQKFLNKVHHERTAFTISTIFKYCNVGPKNGLWEEIEHQEYCMVFFLLLFCCVSGNRICIFTEMDVVLVAWQARFIGHFSVSLAFTESISKTRFQL